MMNYAHKTGPSSPASWIAPVVLAFAVPISCCGILFGLPVLWNNWLLQRFADNLYNYPLPPSTRNVERYSRVGLLGNGNHCLLSQHYWSQCKMVAIYSQNKWLNIHNIVFLLYK